MVGSIDISPDGTCLLVSFPYREDLVNLVRTIPGRRWDRSTKTWKVPVAQVETAVRTFMAYGFNLSPEVTAALATGGKEGSHGTAQLKEVDRGAKSLTISALNLRIAETIQGSLKEPVWVVGELQNFEKNRRGKHLYFELVERESEEPDARARAVIPAVIFEKNWALMQRRLSRYQDVDLADGVKVRMRGSVDFYQPRGKIQLRIDDIDPAYTVGEQVVRREKILAELEKEGLRERQKERDFPLVPLRIALLTSFGSDAYNDIIQTLNDRDFRFEITVFDCFVQGDRLRPSVLQGLEFFAENAENFDLLLIARGGGSRSELGAWDDLDVARAVAAHPLPALIGIGHERDKSVLDEIARSVKTPTAAAETIYDRCRAYQERVEDCMLEIADRALGLLREERRSLHRKADLLKHRCRASLARAEGDLNAAAARIGTLSRQRLLRARTALFYAGNRLGRAALERLRREGDRLSHLGKMIRSLDPARILDRGFALLLDERGRSVRDAREVGEGARLRAKLANGALDLRVEGRHVENEKK